MEMIISICNKLSQKQELFITYEKITQEMIDCKFEEMDALTQKRFELAQKIDVIDSEIFSLCEDREYGALIRNAVRNLCNRDAIPQEMHVIFDKSQEIFCVINRIRNLETQVVERLETNKLKIEDKIKASKDSPKIAKYLSTASGGPVTGVLLGSRFSKI